MNNYKKIATYAILLPLLFIQFSCEELLDEAATGVMVGTWKLTALSGTYIRDVAVPAGTDSTTYSLKVRWPHDTSEGYQADQTLATYSTGDTVLNTTSDASALVAAGAVVVDVVVVDVVAAVAVGDVGMLWCYSF